MRIEKRVCIWHILFVLIKLQHDIKYSYQNRENSQYDQFFLADNCDKILLLSSYLIILSF